MRNDILVGIADNPNSINHRVEIETIAAAIERVGESATNTGRRAGIRIQGIYSVTAAQTLELAGQWSEIYGER